MDRNFDPSQLNTKTEATLQTIDSTGGKTKKRTQTPDEQSVDILFQGKQTNKQTNKQNETNE